MISAISPRLRSLSAADLSGVVDSCSDSEVALEEAQHTACARHSDVRASTFFYRQGWRCTTFNCQLSGAICFQFASLLNVSTNLDCELTMLSHINNISLICFFRLHRLRKLCQLLDTTKPQRIVATIIISRIDYCKAVFAGQPAASCLRCELSAAARLVIGLDVHDSVSKAMKLQHWLSVL